MPELRHIALLIEESETETSCLNEDKLKKCLEVISECTQIALNSGCLEVSFFFKEKCPAFSYELIRDFPFYVRILENGLIPPAEHFPVLNLAFSYSEKALLLNIIKENLTGQITEKEIQAFLEKSGWTEPDLVILTNGNRVLGDSLTWSIAYSELYFSPLSWKEFNAAELERAISEFRKRERRFGKLHG